MLQHARECPFTRHLPFSYPTPTGQCATHAAWIQTGHKSMHVLICTAYPYRCAVHTQTHTHCAHTGDCGVQSHMYTHSQASGSQNTDAVWCKIWLTGVCSKPTKCRAKVGNTVPLWMGAWNEWSAYGHPEAEGHRPPLPKGARVRRCMDRDCFVTLQL